MKRTGVRKNLPVNGKKGNNNLPVNRKKKGSGKKESKKSGVLGKSGKKSLVKEKNELNRLHGVVKRKNEKPQKRTWMR